jgi:hypothetical protein
MKGKDKLKMLTDKRRIKFNEYSKTAITSWKKRLRKYELDILDNKIRIEKLKQQFEN